MIGFIGFAFGVFFGTLAHAYYTAEFTETREVTPSTDPRGPVVAPQRPATPLPELQLREEWIIP